MSQHPTREQFAYLAGMIDGEGSVTLRRHRQHKRPHWQYAPRILVTNTHREALLRIQSVFGGNVVLHKAAKGKWKAAYLWRVIGIREIDAILRGCMEFLVIKHEKAVLLAEFAAARLNARGGRYRAPYGAVEDRIYAAMLASRRGR